MISEAISVIRISVAISVIRISVAISVGRQQVHMRQVMVDAGDRADDMRMGCLHCPPRDVETGWARVVKRELLAHAACGYLSRKAAREGARERRGAPTHAEGVGDAMDRIEVVALRLVRCELRGDVTKHGGGGAPHPQVLPRAHELTLDAPRLVPAVLGHVEVSQGLWAHESAWKGISTADALDIARQHTRGVREEERREDLEKVGRAWAVVRKGPRGHPP